MVLCFLSFILPYYYFFLYYYYYYYYYCNYYFYFKSEMLALRASTVNLRIKKVMMYDTADDLNL